jgi:hypothetical protein
MLRRIKLITKPTINSVFPVWLQYRQGDKRNILLFANRRAGSTHLAGLFACEPGMRYVDDPFDLTDFDIHRLQVKEAHLPHVPYSQFISLSDSEADQVDRYMRRLLNGGLPEVQTYWPPKNRTILKIANAATLIDWCAERFEVFTIFLVRHPIPQALSVLRNKWMIQAEAYLSNPVFSSKYLSAVQRQAGRMIMEKGTSLEKAVLNWVLENLYALKHATKIDLTLTYEELVLYPAKAMNLFAETVGLENFAGMLQRISTPSMSSQFSDSETIKAIKRNEKEFLINKWSSKVDKTEKDRIGEILNTFEITEYNSDGFMPSERMCHFGGHTSDK